MTERSLKISKDCHCANNGLCRSTRAFGTRVRPTAAKLSNESISTLLICLVSFSLSNNNDAQEILSWARMLSSILRFTKKMIEKEAAAAEKKYDASRKKALDALKKSGDVETARIYAETAVQNRTSHNQFLIMASRIDSVLAKVRPISPFSNDRSTLFRFNKPTRKTSWSKT